ALKEIKRDAPHSPIELMGFSLGGNIVLKAAGERGDAAHTLIDKVIAVNPPIEMQSSIELLSSNTSHRRH
ncbi:MAG: hypothetical protein AAF466_12265, partial [Bacteroidota bacterium]